MHMGSFYIHAAVSEHSDMELTGQTKTMDTQGCVMQLLYTVTSFMVVRVALV